MTSLKRPRTLGGTGVINRAGKATNFHYYGLPSNTNVNYSGSAGFVGVIYAPSAALSFGDGVNATEVMGAYERLGLSFSRQDRAWRHLLVKSI